MSNAEAPYRFEHSGWCLICEKAVVFEADGPYFRSTLKCPSCLSVPRNRALARAIEQFKPDWRSLTIHESSPGWDGLTYKLVAQAKTYVASHFNPDLEIGAEGPLRHPCKSYINVDLERQQFEDDSFDVMVTQDVFEHIFNPDLAIREIARTLRPGGAFFATVPIVNGKKPSVRRARMKDDNVEMLLPPEYHGNPINNEGSLVVFDWGFDIAAYLQHHSGLSIVLLQQENMNFGIAGQLTDVIVGLKQPNLPQ